MVPIIMVVTDLICLLILIKYHMVNFLLRFLTLYKLNFNYMNILIFLTITVTVALQDAISIKKKKRREAEEKLIGEEDVERISYSDDIYAPFKPGKQFKTKPDIKHPGSCNRFLLVSESTTGLASGVMSEGKSKKMLNTDIIIDSTNGTLKSYLSIKKSENRTKDELKQVYKKLAEDFKILQDLLEKEKYSTFGTLFPAGQNLNNESRINENNNTSNVLTIEDVNSNKGPLTRITLLRRSIIEKKDDLDIPLIPYKNNGLNNKYVKLKIEREDEEANENVKDMRRR